MLFKTLTLYSLTFNISGGYPKTEGTILQTCAPEAYPCTHVEQSYKLLRPFILQYIYRITLRHYRSAIIEYVISRNISGFMERAVITGVEDSDTRRGFKFGQILQMSTTSTPSLSDVVIAFI